MTDTVTQSLFVTEVQICLNTRIFTRKEITKMEDKWSITRLRIKKIQERFLNLFGFFICVHVWFSDYSMRFTNWAVRKNDQNINSKETRRGEGPEYSILFSKCIRKIMFYMFYMYLWNLLHFLRHFIVGFFKVSSENITLIWRFVHVHLFVFKRLIIKV